MNDFFFLPQPRVLAFVLSNVAALPLICRKKNVLGMIGSGKLKRKKKLVWRTCRAHAHFLSLSPQPVRIAQLGALGRDELVKREELGGMWALSPEGKSHPFQAPNTY
jgi:hypothetical protein